MLCAAQSLDLQEPRLYKERLSAYTYNTCVLPISNRLHHVRKVNIIPLYTIDIDFLANFASCPQPFYFIKNQMAIILFPENTITIHYFLDYSVYKNSIGITMHWRQNERDGVSNHQRLDCVLKRLFRRRSTKTSKLHPTGVCKGNPSVTGGFPSQKASDTENVFIRWRHHSWTSYNIWLDISVGVTWGAVISHRNAISGIIVDGSTLKLVKDLRWVV